MRYLYLYSKDEKEEQILDYSLQGLIKGLSLKEGYYHFYDTERKEIIKVRSFKEIATSSSFYPSEQYFYEVRNFKGILHTNTIINIEYGRGNDIVRVVDKDTFLSSKQHPHGGISCSKTIKFLWGTLLKKCPDTLLKQVPCEVLDREKLERYIESFRGCNEKWKLLGLPRIKRLKKVIIQNHYVFVDVEIEKQDARNTQLSVYEKIYFRGIPLLKVSITWKKMIFYLDKESFHREYMFDSNLYEVCNRMGFYNE